jgi:integrase
MTATLKMRNTTVGKQLGFLRWFLRWASQHGYYSGTLHDTFRPKLKGSHFEQKEIIFLTLDELQTVENWVFSTDKAHLERARDVFVFCCYTGLRFSDAAKLKRDDVHDDYISVVTKKTSDRLRIELNRHSRAILDKYKDTELPNNRALPAISNQKTNDYLKDIGKECKIDEPVRDVYFIGNERIEEVFKKYEKMSTHCARRTFVCTALQLEVPSEVITRWTGHSDLKSMKPYIAIVDELKAKNMSKFDKI